MTIEMFDPVSPHAAASPRVTPLPLWRPILPAPADAPVPRLKHPKLGEPAAAWRYIDAAGQLLGVVCRFNLGAGGKEIRSLVFAVHEKFGREWRWQGLPRPRPLYGLDRLAGRPDAPVIVCEGEKAADSAETLLPDYVAVTSPGGSKAAKAADWSPLKARRVTIWPDADPPGEAYARDVVDLLARLGLSSIAIIKPPSGKAAGWDAADALAEGMMVAEAAELVAEAAPPGTGSSASPKTSRRDALIATFPELELWHDVERNAYATVSRDGHRENHGINSREFRALFAWHGYEATGASPSRQALDDACRVLEAKALNQGPCHPVWRRVAAMDDRIYVDLACARWRTVEVTAHGWQIVNDVPVKFLRARGIAPLPEPEAGEMIESLRAFVNVESDADFQLLLAWLVAAFRPNGPFPILMLIGEQGSSKSTLARICKLLVDPNVSPIRSLPADERDLLVAAFNSWLLAYDNLSSIPSWLSDAFCRLSTGGGFATRQLHSDRNETIFAAQRPMVFNGIGELANRPDLADRAICLPLPPLPEEQRRPEREFWAAFEKERPAIFGALLDAVSAGLRHLPDVKLEKPPRMADFAEFAEACSSGFGWERGEFLAAYAENQREVVACAADASPLVPLIEFLVGLGGYGPEGFDGTAHDLLIKLRDQASEVTQRAPWFPKTDAQMGTRLRREVPLLKSRGIIVERYKQGRQKTRKLVLRCSSRTIFEALRARLKGERSDNEDNDQNAQHLSRESSMSDRFGGP